MSVPKLIDLSEAFQPIPQVKLRDGRLVTVKPLTGLEIDLRQKVAENPNDKASWYALAKRCLPGLTQEEVMALSDAEVVTISLIAAEQYETVNAMIAEQGKARASIAGDGSAPSSSIPEMASGTSAPS